MLAGGDARAASTGRPPRPARVARPGRSRSRAIRSVLRSIVSAAPVDRARVVAARVEGDPQAVLGGEADGRGDVVGRLGVDDGDRPLVDGEVPGLPRDVPASRRRAGRPRRRFDHAVRGGPRAVSRFGSGPRGGLGATLARRSARQSPGRDHWAMPRGRFTPDTPRRWTIDRRSASGRAAELRAARPGSTRGARSPGWCARRRWRVSSLPHRDRPRSRRWPMPRPCPRRRPAGRSSASTGSAGGRRASPIAAASRS